MINDLNGKVMKNTIGDLFKIVSITGRTCGVVFDGYPQIQYKNIDYVVTGAIKNNFKPFVYGKGYFGYRSRSERPPMSEEYKYVYEAWKSMLRRCYSVEDGKWKNHKIFNVSVCDEWMSFKNFYEWTRTPISNFKIGYELDKDIIGGGFEYSPHSCVFIPKELNNAFAVVNPLQEYPTGVKLCCHKYYAIISLNKKKFHLGNFNTIKDAALTYKIAKSYSVVALANRLYNESKIPLWLKEYITIKGWTGKWIDKDCKLINENKEYMTIDELVNSERLKQFKKELDKERSETIRTESQEKDLVEN